MSLIARLATQVLPYVPKSAVGLVARRYIAGETLEDALRRARELNSRGFRTTLDLLGEDTTTAEGARRALADYRMTLEAIERQGIDGNVSVKPTQFGLRVDPGLCLNQFRALAGEARKLGHFVRVEMENSLSTDATLALYRRLREDFDNVGAVLQACLHRTGNDLDQILGLRPNVRIVKGVYLEPPDIAWQDRQTIRDRYVAISETLVRNGCYAAFATHDEFLVEEAGRLVREYEVPTSRYEFQLLLGVREALGRSLLDAGHPVRIYVPFGEDWYPYSMRRLRENPRIAAHVVGAMLPGR
jgi:proline dehydrogenase